MIIKKHITVLFIMCACLTQGIYGQNKFEPEWNVGVGFGPTFSSVDLLNGRNIGVPTKSWQQFHGGIGIRYMSEKNLGILAELNYSQQGWQEEFVDQPQFSHSHKLNYMEVPVLTHIYFGRKVRFIFNLGPKIGFLLSENEDMSKELSDYLASGDMSDNRITHQYYRDAEIKVDYGLLAGMGLEVRTGIGNFSLEGRYYFGLGDMYNNRKTDYFSRSAQRVISARLTYYVKIF